MKALVFSTKESLIRMKHEAHALKAAYLLADSVRVFGQIGTHIQYVSRSKKLSFKLKVDAMEESFAEDKHEEGLKYISSVKQGIKVFNLIKHPTQKHIVANSTMERAFLNYYNDYLINYTHSMKEVGLAEMGPLLEEGVLETFPFKKSEKIVPLENLPKIDIAEEILALLYPSGNPQDSAILFLPLDFISNDFTEVEVISANINEVQEKPVGLIDSMRITDYVQLSALEYLSAQELKTLRNQLSDDGKLCKEKIAAFIKMNGEGKESVLDRKKFMENKFSPEVVQFQAKFDENTIIKFIKTNEASNALIYQLYVGEAPLAYYWKYFEELEYFDAATLKYIKDKVESNEKHPSHIPFVCVTAAFTNNEFMTNVIAESKEELKVPQPRKFIAVDD